MNTAVAFQPAPVTSTIDIPIIIRGRIIEPTADNSFEFGGRVGARFRAPDPKKYASQLVLADPSLLMDLHNTPIDEIIDFLVELGTRLTLEKNPMMRLAFKLCLEAGELTESVLRPIYQQMPHFFARASLNGTVEKQIGKAYLDGWVEQGRPGRSSMRVRAIGTRNMHIIAGNVPLVAASTVIRSALTKGDCLIKTPSNDPYTATAIVRTMIEMDPNHPVTKHFAVAYWKGGDEAIEKEIYRPSRIEKLTAWGGMKSMTHIQKYLVPGIELIPLNPKLSISIVGHEALAGGTAMEEAAEGVALMAGRMNQAACASTRVVYVECGTDEADLERLEQFGHAIHKAFLNLPPEESTAPKVPNSLLERELNALALDEEFYRVIGNTSSAGVIVSRTEDEPVEFARMLSNRIVNLVPVADITKVPNWVNEETQTVGIFPESLRVRLRDRLALHGVQRMMPMREQLRMESDGGSKHAGVDPEQTFDLPHDGSYVMARMVRWVIDQSEDLV